MASQHEIKCINKSDRTNIHERINYIGGLNANGNRWKISLQDAIDAIETNKWNFYVSKNGKQVNVIIAKSAAGYKYLKTEADDTTTDNLLSLPECPN